MNSPTPSEPDPQLLDADVGPDEAIPAAKSELGAITPANQPADDPNAVDEASRPASGNAHPRQDRLQQVFTWIVLVLIVAAIVILVISIRRHDASSGAPAAAFERLVHGPIVQSVS